MPRSPEVRISLRLTPDMHQAIKAAAEQDMRSLNSQIELAIREHLERRQQQQQGDPPR